MKTNVFTALLLGLAILPRFSHANDLDPIGFEKTIQKYRLQSSSSYCYKDEAGTIFSNHLSELRNIGSLTKLFTTLLAVDHYDLQHEFRTKFHLLTSEQPDTLPYLYIEGDLDPTINADNLRLLALEIRKLGSLQKIVFDSKFVAYLKNSHDDPQQFPSLYDVKSMQKMLTKKFGIATESTSQNLSEFIADKNSAGQSIQLLRTFIHKSWSVQEILKVMNTKSDNSIADILFDSIPKEARENIFIKYEFPENEIKLFNGSGYPVYIGGARADNKASCGSILNTLTLLSGCLQNKCMSLNEVFQQSCDPGTLQSYNYFPDKPEIEQNILGKTAYTMYVRGLAGWTDITKQIPFVFLIATKPNTPPSNARGAMIEVVNKLYQTTSPYSVCEADSVSTYPVDFFSFRLEENIQTIAPLPARGLERGIILESSLQSR